VALIGHALLNILIAAGCAPWGGKGHASPGRDTGRLPCTFWHELYSRPCCRGADCRRKQLPPIVDNPLADLPNAIAPLVDRSKCEPVPAATTVTLTVKGPFTLCTGAFRRASASV